MCADFGAARAQGIDQSLLQRAEPVEPGQTDIGRHLAATAFQALQLPAEITHRLQPTALLAQRLEPLPPDQELPRFLGKVIRIQAEVPFDQQAIGLLRRGGQTGRVEQRCGIKVLQRALDRLLPQQALLCAAQHAARHLVRCDVATKQRLFNPLIEPDIEGKGWQGLPLLPAGCLLARMQDTQAACETGGGTKDE